MGYFSISFQQGRNFEASLRASGLIESAGGETFRTPMAWMRAVTGSWNTVKQSQAYKMVTSSKQYNFILNLSIWLFQASLVKNVKGLSHFKKRLKKKKRKEKWTLLS